MDQSRRRVRQQRADERTPRELRLPGFLVDEEVGLGDAIARVTSGFGIRTCGGCQRRAAALNRWLVFRGTRPG